METIQSETLKTIRKARKLGRPKLARLSGMTERQVSKLEATGSGHGEVSLSSLLRLADVLQVPTGVLTGEVPISDEDLRPLSDTKCTNGCCG